MVVGLIAGGIGLLIGVAILPVLSLLKIPGRVGAGIGTLQMKLAGKPVGGNEIVEKRDQTFEIGNFKPERPPAKNQSWCLGAPFGVTYEVDEGCFGGAATREIPSGDKRGDKMVTGDGWFEPSELKKPGRGAVNVHIPTLAQSFGSVDPTEMIEDAELESVVEEGGDTAGIEPRSMLVGMVIMVMLGAAMSTLYLYLFA